MSRSNFSWLDRLVSGCFTLLVAAIALYVSVQLVESVWIEIVIGLIAAVAAAVVVAVIRRRLAGW